MAVGLPDAWRRLVAPLGRAKPTAWPSAYLFSRIKKIRNKIKKTNEKGPVAAYHRTDVREATTGLAQTCACVIHYFS
jgi:hypothetical protein